MYESFLNRFKNIVKVYDLQFWIMLSCYFIIIFNYHVLKDLKDTLVVMTTYSGAHVIPYLKLWVMLPVAFIAMFLTTSTIRKIGKIKTFYATTFGLCAFYALFAFYLFPRLSFWQSDTLILLADNSNAWLSGMLSLLINWPVTIFYVASESWSIIILSFFFWTIVHDITNIKKARAHFPIYVTLGSCAGMLSGFVSKKICTSDLLWDYAVMMMIAVIILSSLVLAFLVKIFIADKVNKNNYRVSIKNKNNSFSLSSLFAVISRKKYYILWISFIVVGYNVAINIAEIFWKESLVKLYVTDSSGFNAHISQTTLYIGLFSGVLGMLSPLLFNQFGWRKIAFVTPVVLFLFSIIFCIGYQFSDAVGDILGINNSAYIPVMFGSILVILAKTLKYTIFDSCKEMAFLPLPADLRTEGKAVVEMLASRLGKSGPSLIFQLVLMSFSTIAQGSMIMFGVVFVILALSLMGTKKVGVLAEE